MKGQGSLTLKFRRCPEKPSDSSNIEVCVNNEKLFCKTVGVVFSWDDKSASETCGVASGGVTEYVCHICRMGRKEYPTRFCKFPLRSSETDTNALSTTLCAEDTLKQ